MYAQDQHQGKGKVKPETGELHGETWYYKDTPDPNDKPPTGLKKKKIDNTKSTYTTTKSKHPQHSHKSGKHCKKRKNGEENGKDHHPQISRSTTSVSKFNKQGGSKINVTSSKSQVRNQKESQSQAATQKSSGPTSSKKLKNGEGYPNTSNSMSSMSSSSKSKGSKQAGGGSKLNVTSSKSQIQNQKESQSQAATQKSSGPTKSKKLKNGEGYPNTSNSMSSMSSSSKSKGSKQAGGGSKLNVTSSKSQIQNQNQTQSQATTQKSSLGPTKSKKMKNGLEGEGYSNKSNSMSSMSSSSKSKGSKQGGDGSKLNVTSSKSQTKLSRNPTKSQSTTQITKSGKRVNYNPTLVESKSFTSLKSRDGGGAGGGSRSKGRNISSYTSKQSKPSTTTRPSSSKSNFQSHSQSQMSMKSKKSNKNYSQSQTRMTTRTASSVSQYSDMTRMTGGEYEDEDMENGNGGNQEENLGNRLMVHQRTKIDLIKDSVPKPEGYLPPRYLPTWEDMPIEQRLPLLPAPPGVLFFTRGQLGKTILRKNVIYSMDDPMNRVRVPSDKYEELHDPNNQLDKSLIARPYLMKSGTVNEYGEVICTLQEFNRYRRYLASLHNEQVREKIKEMDEQKKMEDELKRKIYQDELTTKGQGKQAIREEKVAYAKQFIKMREEAKRRKFLRNQAIEERRCAELQKEKLEYQAFLVQLNEKRKKMQIRRMKERNLNEEDRARIILHDYTLKEMRAAANKKHVDKNRKIIKEQKDASWFDAKILSAAERLERENEIRAEYSETLKKRAMRRQKNVEKFREQLPLRIARNKEAAERLDRIVRKYFYIWLNKVRARLHREVDEDHESVFYMDKKNVLKEGVDFLYKQSGYEKLDDVVMNILKFKEALKKQLSTIADDETLDDDDETEFYEDVGDKEEDDDEEDE